MASISLKNEPVESAVRKVAKLAKVGVVMGDWNQIDMGDPLVTAELHNLTPKTAKSAICAMAEGLEGIVAVEMGDVVYIGPRVNKDPKRDKKEPAKSGK